MTKKQQPMLIIGALILIAVIIYLVSQGDKKAADKEKMVKARAFKEGASKDDQMDFLRQYASNSLNK